MKATVSKVSQYFTWFRIPLLQRPLFLANYFMIYLNSKWKMDGVKSFLKAVVLGRS